MNLTVELFARARDLAGRPKVELELPEPCTVKDLREALVSTVPPLEPIVSGLLVAVNRSYARDGDRIAERATVACFPPVSGG
jgi:molybdopterin converting factor subunit 1